MRTLSTIAKRAVLSQQTGEVFLVLLVLDHASFSSPIRVCSDAVPITSAGEEYLAFPFQVTLPDDTDESPPTVRLKIDNVDRRIVEAVRSIDGEAISVAMSVILASSPDTIEAGPFDFNLRNVEYSAATVEGDLMYEDILNEPFPGGMFAPSTFPGLFR